MKRRLADWLYRRLRPQREPDMRIGMPGDDYMRRWYLIPRNPVFNIYLHHFLRSDDPRALHDHPWWNMSFLLHGNYVEHTIAAGGVNHRQRYYHGHLVFRTAKYAHRVELVDGECWTLFITGPKIREWGFHCPQGWRPWQQYTDPKVKGQIGRGCE